MDRLNARIKPTDLFTFGLIPEFTGRLPVIARFRDLDRSMLVRIMTEPRDCIYAQFRDIFGHEGVELSVAPRVFEQISELAMEYRTGARSLRGIFEELITPILYLVPDNPDIRKVTITSLFSDPAYVRGERKVTGGPHLGQRPRLAMGVACKSSRRLASPDAIAGYPS